MTVKNENNREAHKAELTQPHMFIGGSIPVAKSNNFKYK